MNIMGEVVHTVDQQNFDGQTLKLNLSELASGVYYIHVNADKQNYSEKITIIK